MSSVESFWAKVDRRGEDECWLWTAGTDGRYGTFAFWNRDTLKDERWKAHRLAYTLLVGEIPEGLTLDHLCRVTLCVNPAHLEPVTQAENMRRGFSPSALNSRKTHCKRGHALTDDNLVRSRKGRVCRTCVNASDRRRRALIGIEEAS